VGITHVGLDGHFLRYNSRFCEITGYACAELTGKTFQEITHPDDLKTELGRRERLRKGESSRYALEKRYLRKDGTPVWVDLTVTAQRDDTGRIEYFIAVVQDISRRKQVEELLRENEQRLRLALDAARTGWWEWNVEQDRISWDQRVRELLGIGQRGPAGAKVFFRRVQAEDRATLEALLQEALVNQESFRAEFRVRHADGKILWVALHGRVIRGEQERAVRIMGVMYDITQRKGTEAELRQWNERLETQVAQRTAELTRTIERLHDEVTRRVQAEDTLRRRSQMLEGFFQHTISPLAFLDRGFNFVRVNEAFARGAGKDPDFFVGQNLFTLYPPDGNRAIFERVVRTKQPHRAYAVPYAFPDAPQGERGAAYWNWWLTPLLDDRGEIQFLVWSLEDVTEQQKAMQELQERARQLQQLTLELSQTEDRERKRLAEILHDDLQQILAAAKFHVGLLSSQVQNEAERRAMTEQIKQMLKDAIDKSRSLSHELNPPGLAHNDLFETFEWLASEVRTKHGLLVHLDACERVELASEPLKAFLYRAAQEMLFNVIKHAHVKEAQLRLCRHGERVYLSVADRGRGFDPQTLGGTGGLGLASMRERVKLLGGRMRIKSAWGRGSVFVVAVPDPRKPAPGAHHYVPEEPAGMTVAPPSESHEGTGDHPLRVLLVDDHKIVRAGIEIMLAGEPDIEIVGQAGNGREAVELARRLRPDVVVMDVSMPVMPGDEATRRIKQDLPQARVVALSMHDNAAVAEKMRRAGAAAYLLKTAPSESLLAAIRGHEVVVRA
jgi:PAS domain S-box-containing protein